MPDTDLIHELLINCMSVVDRHDWLFSQQGWGFNVFDVLGRTTDEVKGHSALIGELLNPQGSHGQGATFLNAFFDCLSTLLLPESLKEGILTSDATWSTAVERPIALGSEAGNGFAGRIDIIIETDDACVIIENKINAVDQEKQLERYSQFASATGKKCLLVYLTLEGAAPSRYSLGQLNESDVLRLSYRYHISSWLSECIRLAATIPRVRETLVQYRRLVRRISTGMRCEEMTNEISDLLVGPKNLRIACEVERALPLAKSRVHMAFWDKLAERLTEMFDGQTGDYIKGHRVTRELVESFHGPGRSPREFGLSFRFIELPGGGTLAWVCEVYREFYYGLSLCHDQERVELGNEPEVTHVLAVLESMDPAFKRDKSIFWKYSHPILNWETFDNDCAFLASESHLDSVVKNIWVDIGRITHNLSVRLNKSEQTIATQGGEEHDPATGE